MTAALSMEPFTEEQCRVRRGGIGGSDIGPIAYPGYPFGGLHKVWMDKTGRRQQDPDTEDSLYGRLSESMSRQLYELRTGRKVAVPGTLVHPTRPLVRATPDGLIAGERVLEIKAPRYADDWGEDGSQDIPPYYWPQVTWEMAAAQLPRCDVVALIGRTIRVYPDLPFDAELFEALYERATHFWEQYVVPDCEPPIDGSDDANRFLRRKYPNAGPLWLEDDSAEVAAWARQYQRGEALEAEGGLMKREAKNQLIARIGTAAGIRGSWGSVSHKNVKARLTTDWEAIRRELGIPDEVIQKHTATGTSYRRFWPRFAKDGA